MGQDFDQSGLHDSKEALSPDAELLRRRQKVLDRIDEGTRQLRNGEGIVLRGEQELNAYFKRLHDEGMLRFEAKRKE
jgi:hypothetical protein